MNQIDAAQEPLADGDLHIWTVAPAHVEPPAAGILSAAERQRAAQFLDGAARQRYIASHIVLRELLGRYCGHRPQDLTIDGAPGRKPTLPDFPSLTFSLSRSANWVLIGIAANKEVGVDIERRQEIDGLDGLIARYLRAEERLTLASLNAACRLARFYDIWTRKEAWLKLTGQGLSVPLSEIGVSTHDSNDDGMEGPLQDERWFGSPPVPHPFSASVAAHARPDHVVYFEYDGVKPLKRVAPTRAQIATENTALP